MIKTVFTRPDWSRRPARALHRVEGDIVGLDGTCVGSRRVYSHPQVAVQHMQMSTTAPLVREAAVVNVPPALGLVDVDCRGDVVWRIHGRDVSLSGRRQLLVYLSCPEDGFSHIFQGPADMRMSSTFASMARLRAMAEENPEELGSILRRVEACGGDDCIIDLSEFIGNPMQQNALAAIFAQPLLGNSSEAFIFDNLTTYLGGLADERKPSAALMAARYDAALRSKIFQAREYIEANLAAPLSLRLIALAVGTNENYLKAGFRREFGTTVFGYLYECRMEAARRLLEHTDLSAEDIGRQVGYAEPVSFSTAFRRRFGLPPGRYRALCAGV